MTAASVGAVATAGTGPIPSRRCFARIDVRVFLLLLGLVRGGFLANLLKSPVISALSAPAPMLIAASQLRHIFGIEGGGHTLIEILNSLAKIYPTGRDTP